MKKIWVHKAKSFADAAKFDRLYYAGLSPEARLDIVQMLREEHFKIHRALPYENGKRLRRVLTIIEQE
ncbi:MAG: hypothetical protein WCP22_11460 [Chlamydiota bacterium]